MAATPESTQSLKATATTWDAKHAVLLILATAAAIFAWTTYREEIHDRSQMQTTISAEEQQRKQGEADLKARLAAIEKDKATPKTLAQIIEKIPQYIPLPQPLQIESQPVHSTPLPNASPAITSPTQIAPATELPDQPKPYSQHPSASLGPAAVIPESDVKALYAFAANCQECQLKLSSAQKQIQGLTVERDAAVKAAKGGSFWTRLKRNAKWFAVGAGVGTAALCGTGHCK